MKTSILISSFAALCILATYAVSPRRHGEDKMNLASTDNISIITVKRVTMLPVVIITAYRKKDAGVTVPVIPVEDFNYLKFEAAEYMEEEAISPDEGVMLPEAMESDYSYLKFKISDNSTGSELPGAEIKELPENEYNTTNISTPKPAANEFDYLRFDVNHYINNSGTEANEIGELPLKVELTANHSGITVPCETTNEHGYLKFDVTNYYSSANLSSGEQFELTEE